MRANGPASGPVFLSLFLVVPNHSAIWGPQGKRGEGGIKGLVRGIGESSGDRGKGESEEKENRGGRGM